MIGIALIAWPVFGQSPKTYIYRPNGTIAGWIEQIPGGSTKQAIYDNSGNRIGTIEPGQNGPTVLETIPNSTMGSPLNPPNPFGYGPDPFSQDDGD